MRMGNATQGAGAAGAGTLKFSTAIKKRWRRHRDQVCPVPLPFLSPSMLNHPACPRRPSFRSYEPLIPLAMLLAASLAQPSYPKLIFASRGTESSSRDLLFLSSCSIPPSPGVFPAPCCLRVRYDSTSPFASRLGAVHYLRVRPLPTAFSALF